MDKDDNIGVFVVGLLTGGFIGFLAGNIVGYQARQKEDEEEEFEELLAETRTAILRASKSNPGGPAKRMMNPQNY